MAKEKSKELEELLIKLNNVNEDFKEKRISQYENALRTKTIYEKIKKNHWDELGFKEKSLIKLGLSTSQIGISLLGKIQRRGGTLK